MSDDLQTSPGKTVPVTKLQNEIKQAFPSRERPQGPGFTQLSSARSRLRRIRRSYTGRGPREEELIFSTIVGGVTSAELQRPEVVDHDRFSAALLEIPGISP